MIVGADLTDHFFLDKLKIISKYILADRNLLISFGIHKIIKLGLLRVKVPNAPR